MIYFNDLTKTISWFRVILIGLYAVLFYFHQYYIPSIIAICYAIFSLVVVLANDHKSVKLAAIGDIGFLSAILWFGGPQIYLISYLLIIFFIMEQVHVDIFKYLYLIPITLVMSFSPSWITQLHDSISRMIEMGMITLLFAYVRVQYVDLWIRTHKLQDKISEVIKISEIDPLTKVHTRSFMMSQLKQLFSQKHKIGLLFIDVNKFKFINDTHGHPVGDVVLSEISSRIVSSVRQHDIVSRYAGDEFIVIIDSDERSVIDTITERITTSINKYITVNDITLMVTCSIGATITNPEQLSLQDTIALADKAMYKAKKSNSTKHIWAL